MLDNEKWQNSWRQLAEQFRADVIVAFEYHLANLVQIGIGGEYTRSIEPFSEDQGLRLPVAL